MQKQKLLLFCYTNEHFLLSSKCYCKRISPAPYISLALFTYSLNFYDWCSPIPHHSLPCVCSLSLIVTSLSSTVKELNIHQIHFYGWACMCSFSIFAIVFIECHLEPQLMLIDSHYTCSSLDMFGIAITLIQIHVYFIFWIYRCRLYFQEVWSFAKVNHTFNFFRASKTQEWQSSNCGHGWSWVSMRNVSCCCWCQ